MVVAKRLTGRTAIVTGASRGIGRAIAERLSEEGAYVACLDIDVENAHSVAANLTTPGLAVPVDVTDEKSVESAISEVIAEAGALHILVNNAGIAGPQEPAATTDLAEWRKTVAVNLTGPFLCSKIALPHLNPTGGTIINIASALAFIGWPGEAAYGPTKAALVQLTKGMALDYAGKVRVNCICPGAVRTPMIESVLPEGAIREAAMAEYGRIHPLFRRLAEPREIADAVLFLASDDASLITGAAVLVDGGLTAG
jgi:NAD(P)-dependent dehydrogenase (short-subunit alcohol dehydrogenase family)